MIKSDLPIGFLILFNPMELFSYNKDKTMFFQACQVLSADVICFVVKIW